MNPVPFIIRSTIFAIVLSCWPAAARLADTAVLSDPTRPPDHAEIRVFFGSGDENPVDTAFQLQSVLISNQRRIAIINGRRLSEGDRIENAKVSRIEAGRVVMQRDGQSFILNISSRRLSDDEQRQIEASHVQ